MKHYISLDDYKCRMKSFIEDAGLRESVGMMNALTVAEGLNSVTKADICWEFAEKIKGEIKDLKAKQQSSNTDYYTGYMSALSTVEGFLAGMEGE